MICVMAMTESSSGLRKSGGRDGAVKAPGVFASFDLSANLGGLIFTRHVTAINP